MPDISLSLATKEDCMEAALMGKMFHKEALKNGYKLGFSMEKFEQMYMGAVEAPEYFYMLAKNEDTNEHIGFFIGCLHNPLFSDDILATELFWWVEKECRGRGIAIALIKEFERWAKSNNATQVNVSDLQNVKNLGKLYNRLGYQESEMTYRKDLV